MYSIWFLAKSSSNFNFDLTIKQNSWGFGVFFFYKIDGDWTKERY